jgi:two-component system CheB/CheR fusion protein
VWTEFEVGRQSELDTAAPQAASLDHVVGIGASAGGLEALQELLANLVTGGRVAYVVAQHLSPEHRSLLVDLLAHATHLRVVPALDGAVLQPDVLAIAPPNHDVAVEADRLRVTDPLPRFGPSPCIDLLFESIAEHWKERGVAVVLSGTGSDGARGVRAVRAAGGLTIAQSPESAKFAGMPRNAVSLGGADLILDAAAIGERLAELVASGGDWLARTLPGSEPLLLQAVTTRLRQATSIDFSQYKATTLRRQVERRMAIRQIDSPEEYLTLLAADREEVAALVQNLLVTVTSFFRDTHAFEALSELLRAYVARRAPGEQVRVWVPGCATGEEVYSIAMVISEVLGHPEDLSARLKIFGTDLDEHSLANARRAVYSLSAVKAIPEQLRGRYVIEAGEEMEISADLRSCAVFARHNVAEDPPFPSLDLISCRNTLIYFTAPMQERVLQFFRYGLRPGGLLFLGSSESLGNRTAGFSIANAEHRIYAYSQEERGRLRYSLALPVQRASLPYVPAARIAVIRETVPEQHMALLEALTRSLCAPCLVLDENHDLVEVVGDVSPYCRLPEGRMTSSVNAFLRPELQSEARALFLMARADGVPLASRQLRLKDMDVILRLEVRPLLVGERPLTLLSFVRQADGGADGGSIVSQRDGHGERDALFDQEIERLERELLASQETLRRSLAELEQANEELEASSEELQASSEELQSSNEELEASNEELQSTNEELSTLNEQLRSRSEELEQLNTDLENIQTSLSQGMVIVDRDLRVTRFSPLAVRVFGLVDTDIGKPLQGVPTTVPLPGLHEALQAVVGGETRRSLEAGSEEVAYLAQVLPYLERDGRRRGAIITLTDVSEQVALRMTAEAALEEFSSLTDALSEAVWKRDHTMNRLLYASRRIQTLTGWPPSELCDRPGLLDEAIVPEDRERVTAARDLRQGRWSVSYRLHTRDGRQIWVLESAKVVNDGEGFVVGTLADVTELRALEQHAEDLSATFESVFHSRSFGVAVLDDQLRVAKANDTFCAMVGFEPGAIVGVPCAMLTTELDREALLPEGASFPPRSLPAAIRTIELKHLDGSTRRRNAEVRSLARPSGKILTTIIIQAGSVGLDSSSTDN